MNMNQTGMILTDDSARVVMRAVATMEGDPAVESLTLRISGGFSPESLAAGDVINVKVHINRSGVLSLA